MAIYTVLNIDEITSILKNYNIGSLEDYSPIEEGIENTNYKILVDKKYYILTIYEKRVDESDLPFFCSLTSELHNKKFKCPLPIKNKMGKEISDFRNKKLTILSYIQGETIKDLTDDMCFKIGTETAKLHLLTEKMKLSRKNSLSVESWIDMYSKLEKKLNQNDKKLISFNLLNVENNWPQNLPIGIIHGDIFWDNIIFFNNEVNGIIDYTFSCNDFYAYEIAICINSLGFDKKNNEMEFNKSKTLGFLKGYEKIRKINQNEKNALQILCQGASLRFLLTRLIDYNIKNDDAIVTVKDPNEFLDKLKFFQKNIVSEIIFK